MLYVLQSYQIFHTDKIQEGRIVVRKVILISIQQFAPPAHSCRRGELLYEEQPLLKTAYPTTICPFCQKNPIWKTCRRGELLYEK